MNVKILTKKELPFRNDRDLTGLAAATSSPAVMRVKQRMQNSSRIISERRALGQDVLAKLPVAACTELLSPVWGSSSLMESSRFGRQRCPGLLITVLCPTTRPDIRHFFALFARWRSLAPSLVPSRPYEACSFREAIVKAEVFMNI